MEEGEDEKIIKKRHKRYEDLAECLDGDGTKLVNDHKYQDLLVRD